MNEGEDRRRPGRFREQEAAGKGVGEMKNKILLRKMRRWAVPYTLSTIMVACRNFLITWLTALIGSSVLNLAEGGRTSDLSGRLATLALYILAFLAFDTIGLFWQSVTIHRMRNQLSAILYDSILKARYDKVSAMGQKGELLSRMNSDVETVSSILGGILMPCMTLISGIGATVTVAAVHWRLCLLAYGVGALCWAAQTLVIRKERATIAGLQENRAAALGLCGEGFQNALTIRLCGLVDAFEEKVLGNLFGFRQLSRRLALQKTAEGAGGTLLQYLQSVGMLFAGCILYQRGEIRLGDMVVLYQMTALITAMFLGISSGYAAFQSWIVGFRRLHDILDLEEERGPSGGEDLRFSTRTEAGIQVRGVVCQGGHIAYGNLSLEAKGLYLLMGESGRGKTTFFRLLTGIYPYESGTIRLFGRKLEEYTLESIRSQITYMPQEDALFQGTVRENLLWRSSAEDERILALLGRLGLERWVLGLEKGLDTPMGSGGVEFSGGQRKCLLLARALLEDSPVYLLDEPFAGVDRQHSLLIWEELGRLAEDALVIVVAHDVAALEKEPGLVQTAKMLYI